MNQAKLTKILNDHAFWLNLKQGARANLQGANLQGAKLQGADLRWANLREANLQGANLQGANLQGANLRGAKLQGADLREANLQGTHLHGTKGFILGPQRMDGYQFYFQHPHVFAGCRKMTIKQYREHVKTYDDPAKERETTLILDFLEARVSHRPPDMRPTGVQAAKPSIIDLHQLPLVRN